MMALKGAELLDYPTAADLDAGAAAREFWGAYVTRRPDIYALLTTTRAGPPPRPALTA